MNTRISLSIILSYYCYRYTSGNVDDTVILLDDIFIEDIDLSINDMISYYGLHNKP
jgi:hypothetical protein